VALEGDAKEIRAGACGGRRSHLNHRAPTAGSLFDLASLSKPITATLATVLDACSDLPLDLELGAVWNELHKDLARVILSDLLRHRAGFIPWTPLYARVSHQDQVTELLLSGELLGAQRGTYSDLGYMLWAKTAERAMGQPLIRLLQRRLLRPLGLSREIVCAPPDPRRVVECSLGTERERALAAEQGLSVTLGPPRLGEIQDGNARWLGTYCGHAGLFGSARAVWRLGAEWLKPTVLEKKSAAEALEGRGRLRLGWWKASISGSAGRGLSKRSYGHTGYSGGSLWVDPEAQRVLVLLSHRTAETVDLAPWRRRMHVMKSKSANMSDHGRKISSESKTHGGS
jgi:CubicO group peptidase (beta-lactamase class C family)